MCKCGNKPIASNRCKECLEIIIDEKTAIEIRNKTEAIEIKTSLLLILGKLAR